MRVDKLSVVQYSIPFTKTFKTSGNEYNFREGIWLQIFSNEFVGIGEVAPLVGYSFESLKEVHYALEGFKQSIFGVDLEYEEFFSLIEVHSESLPSLRFGLETALNDILAKQNNLSIAKYLNSNANNEINVNGLSNIHPPNKGYKVIKVKVGYRNLFDEIENMENLSKLYGNKVSFRLDCNGVYDLSQSIRFCKEMEQFNIDYIEQPMPAIELEDLAELRYHTQIPIALDESLLDFRSAEKIIEYQAADVFVLKPMITGGYIESAKIIDLAKDEDIRTVVTSTLETFVGRMSCLHLALANEISEVCGLATGDLLKENSPILINNGKMAILPAKGLGLEIDKNIINVQ